MKMMFTNHSKEDEIFTLTVKEIAQAQKDNAVLKKLSKHDKYSAQLVEDTQLLWLSPKFFRTEQLAGITTAASWTHPS
jgi:hypothetical protein